MADKGTEVARVWSFSDDFMQTPYVVKHGSRNGWNCNCPQHTIRHQTCKHITATRDFKKQPPEVQSKIMLNPEGIKLLKLTPADLDQLNLG
jgi:hypothetical protein